MVIEFPHRKPDRAPVTLPKTKLTGLYILLAFSLLYGLCVWLTQHFGNSQISRAVTAGRFSGAQVSVAATPTATPIHQQVYGRFGVVNAN